MAIEEGASFIMTGGTITENTAKNYGGGIYVEAELWTGEPFSKTGGTITGYDSDAITGNVVKNRSGVLQNGKGHAVYIDSNPNRRKETTAEPNVNLYSKTVDNWDE